MLKKFYDEITGGNRKNIKLISDNGNCFYYFEREFFFTVSITKFKKLLKYLDFNETNFKNLNVILNFEEKYKNKDKFKILITDYLNKNYKGW